MQVPYVCRNNGAFVHTPTITLPAGITAAYTLSTPQTTGASLDVGINVPGYVNTLGASVNATTGAVSINTNGIAVGNYIVTVQITLSQGANVVGTYYENMVFVIRDCAITPTTFANPEIQTINIPAALAGPATINACSGDSVCFTVSASNTNLYRAITITSTWSAGLNAGTPVFTQSTVNYNPASATFCFTAQPSMVGVAQTINFNVLRDDLVDLNYVIQEGDIIRYDEKYWEVDNAFSNQYFMGRNDETHWKSLENDSKYGKNISVVISAHLTRLSQIEIFDTKIGNQNVPKSLVRNL
jgi:hypothetical protein